MVGCSGQWLSYFVACARKEQADLKMKCQLDVQSALPMFGQMAASALRDEEEADGKKSDDLPDKANRRHTKPKAAPKPKGQQPVKPAVTSTSKIAAQKDLQKIVAEIGSLEMQLKNMDYGVAEMETKIA